MVSLASWARDWSSARTSGTSPLLLSAVGVRATSSSISRSGYIFDKFPFNPKILSENGSNIKATVVRLTPEDAHNILSLRNFQRHRRIVQGAAP